MRTLAHVFAVASTLCCLCSVAVGQGLQVVEQVNDSAIVAAVVDSTQLSHERVQIDGQELSVLITDEGDTLLIATELENVSVSSPRSFADEDEAKLYRKYRYYAGKVYPYAVEAIRIFRETEEVTQTMPKRQAKKHIRRLQKELKKEFEDPLKKLTKTQGYILTKMIERDTKRPMHDLIKELRGTMTAVYWTTLGKTVGYQLKDGYIEGADPILDIVLKDYDVSHEVVMRKSMGM